MSSTRAELGIHANHLALVHGRFQAVPLAHVLGGSLVDAVGEAVAEDG
jgi:hypothetical protein